MKLLENLNKRLLLIDGEPCYGGKHSVKRVIETSPIPLPEDYLEFLREISGAASMENPGVEIKVIIPDDEESTLSLAFDSAPAALRRYEEFSDPFYDHHYDDVLDKIWPIGSDLGDLLYVYGTGQEGFGLYVVEAGSLTGFPMYADKIADSLTDLLVNGVGIDTAIWNF